MLYRKTKNLKKRDGQVGCSFDSVIHKKVPRGVYVLQRRRAYVYSGMANVSRENAQRNKVEVSSGTFTPPTSKVKGIPFYFC